MPSKSEKQSKFMRAVAHGWKPRYVKAPPVEVAKEFVAADQAAGMYSGGLAPMNDIQQRGFAPGLTGTAQNFQEGGWVAPQGWRYGNEPISYREARRRSGAGGTANMIAPYFALTQAGWISQPDPDHPDDLDRTMWFPPETVGVATEGAGSASLTPGIVRPPAPDYDPTYGGPAANIDLEEVESRMRHGAGPRGRGGRGGPPGRGGGQPPPPRDIPGALPPGRPPGGDLVPPTGTPYTPPDRRAGRDTQYSRDLLAHRLRVAAALDPASLGLAKGGTVRGYQEGGAARPGHAEGPNPYKEGTARYKLWERKHHVDPPPPPTLEAEEDEETGWLASLLGKKEASETRTERELRELEEKAYGGRVGYQTGGYARAPMGGMPPRVAGMMKPRMGGVPPRLDPRQMATTQPVTGGLEMTTGGPGRPAPRMVPPTVRNLPPRGGRMPWRGAPPPRIRPTPGVDPRGGPGIVPSDGAGPAGGPRVPPNFRGYLNRARMMNRPRRGFPGPAGAGGAPNRVGQSDQQGGLARALQRGTGRPPMSRRSGFYR